MENNNLNEVQKMEKVFSLAKELVEIAGNDILPASKLMERLEKETGLSITKQSINVWTKRKVPPMINVIKFSNFSARSRYYYYPQVKHQLLNYAFDVSRGGRPAKDKSIPKEDGFKELSLIDKVAGTLREE